MVRLHCWRILLTGVAPLLMVWHEGLAPGLASLVHRVFTRERLSGTSLGQEPRHGRSVAQHDLLGLRAGAVDLE